MYGLPLISYCSKSLGVIQSLKMVCLKMVCNSAGGCRAKIIECLGLEGTSRTYTRCTFDSIVFKVMWETNQCTCLKMVCNSKTVGCTAKRINSWDSACTSRRYMEYRWPRNIQVHFEVIWYNCHEIAVNSKLFAAEQNQLNTGTQGHWQTIHGVSLTL